MCRSIKTLYNFKPPATEEEIRASCSAVRPEAEWVLEAIQGQRAGVHPSGR